MTSDAAADAALFQTLRRAWEEIDPMPADLVDRMVAAVAAADLSREYALLTLVESSVAAVRGDAEMLTLQFSDGTTNVLIHVTVTESGGRRIDGWVDGGAVAVELIQEAPESQSPAVQSTSSTDGRFAFDDVPAGVSRLRIELEAPPRPDASAEVLTPRFEV